MNVTAKKADNCANACRGCALLCDDVRIAAGSIGKLRFSNLCSLGETWYQSRMDRSLASGCCANGQLVEWREAVREVAAFLENARAPVFTGLEWVDTRSQQAVVELVRETGGFLSPTFSEQNPAGLNAFRRYGRATCTLGEIVQHRSLVCFWNCDPDDVPPRLVEKYLQQSESVWNIGEGTPFELPGWSLPADRYFGVALTRAEQLQFIGHLRSGKNGADFVSPDKWKLLIGRFQQAEHIVLFIGKGKCQLTGPDPVIDGLHQLARSLNARLPCVILELGGVANSTSSRELLGWSTGQFSSTVCMGGTGSSMEADWSLRNRLLGGNYDVAVMIESQFADGEVVAALTNRGSRRLVCLDSADSRVGKIADVTVNICEAGWDMPGDFFRLDGLPIGLDSIAVSARQSARVFFENVRAVLSGERE